MSLANTIANTFDRLKKAGVDLNTVKFITDDSGRQWVAHLLTVETPQTLTPAPVVAVVATEPKAGRGRPRYKLNDADRLKILELAKSKTYKDIADMFGVVPSTICNIVKKVRKSTKDDKFLFGRPKLQKRGEKVKV